jgi:hypothetical protein
MELNDSIRPQKVTIYRGRTPRGGCRLGRNPRHRCPCCLGRQEAWPMGWAYLTQEEAQRIIEPNTLIECMSIITFICVGKVDEVTSPRLLIFIFRCLRLLSQFCCSIMIYNGSLKFFFCSCYIGPRPISTSTTSATSYSSSDVAPSSAMRGLEWFRKVSFTTIIAHSSIFNSRGCINRTKWRRIIFPHHS